MLTENKPVRFPRSAIRRRLLAVYDQVLLYRQAYIDEYLQIQDRQLRERCDERILFLDNLAHEVLNVTRGLEYWR